MRKIYLFAVVFLVGGVFAGLGVVEGAGSASCSAADINEDGKVNITDLVKVARLFGQRTVPSNLVPEDANNDGQVNIIDLVTVARYFGRSCSAVFAPIFGPVFLGVPFPISWTLPQSVTIDSSSGEYALRLCPEGAVVTPAVPGTPGGCKKFEVSGTFSARRGNEAKRTSETFTLPSTIDSGNYYVSLRVTPRTGASTQEFKSEVFKVMAVPGVFSVVGTARDAQGTLLPSSYSVRVNSGEKQSLGEAGEGKFSVVLANLSSVSTPPVQLGDSLLVEILDSVGNVLVSRKHVVTSSNLADATVNLDIRLETVLPSATLPTCPSNKRGSVCVVSLAFRDPSVTEVQVGQSVGLSAQVLNETSEPVTFTSAYLSSSKGGIYWGLEGGVIQVRALPQEIVLAPKSGTYRYDFNVTFTEAGTYHFIMAFLKGDGVITDAPNGVMTIKVVPSSAWSGSSERVVFVPIVKEQPSGVTRFASVLKSIFWVIGD